MGSDGAAAPIDVTAAAVAAVAMVSIAVAVIDIEEEEEEDDDDNSADAAVGMVGTNEVCVSLGTGDNLSVMQSFPFDELKPVVQLSNTVQLSWLVDVQ